MATPSGTIGLSNVNAELGFSPTALISMNDAAVRTLAGVPSGTISMQNLQNKSNRVTSSATISANTSNYTLNTAKAPGYSSGKTDMTLTIAPGVYVSSASTGSYSLTVDTSWNPGDTVTIVNQGVIVGRGGNGGKGAASNTYVADPGGSGGPALTVQRAISLNNQNRIAGGGGGGGGGGNAFLSDPEGSISMTGGGGGGGIGGSSGGAVQNTQNQPTAQTQGQAGQSGSVTSAGNGGNGAVFFSTTGGKGGNGGGYGSSGSSGNNGSPPNANPWAPGKSGGSAGAAIAGNSNITYINTGTINGSVS
jgi:hypothetical protein